MSRHLLSVTDLAKRFSRGGAYARRARRRGSEYRPRRDAGAGRPLRQRKVNARARDPASAAAGCWEHIVRGAATCSRCEGANFARPAAGCRWCFRTRMQRSIRGQLSRGSSAIPLRIHGIVSRRDCSNTIAALLERVGLSPKTAIPLNSRDFGRPAPTCGDRARHRNKAVADRSR